MNLLPFGDLAAYRERQLVPASVDWADWAQIEPLFDRLENDLRNATTRESLARWIYLWGELSAALDEESSRRYIAMTCHTDHEGAERAYLEYVEKIEPQLKPRHFKLAQLYLDHPERQHLPENRYRVFDRDVQVLVELFRPENVPLETEESKLGQQYQKINGSLTVEFQGEEKTLIQMGRYLEEPDRTVREQAWTSVAARRLREADQFEDIFDALVKLREKIATNAGFKNYRDYAFRARGRFDYTPGDCLRFHDAIEKEIMPLLRQLQKDRCAQLDLPRLRPWDLAVDPCNRPPLRPFQNVDEMVARTQNIFNRLDQELAAEFSLMRDQRLLDLDNRKGKAPGGYQCSLAEARLPFIFMNAIGMQRDVETLLHESGHAFHALAARDEDIYAYRHAPIEFCEVASMAMELLGNRYLEEFYEPADANRARQDHLEGIVKFFPWMATIDAFQHWIYSHPGHTRAERSAAWLALMDRFGDDVDWSGYEETRQHLWHRQLHLFLHPFYYVEYGIAQLGALQVWVNARQDPSRALTAYRRSLALGGSQPLPDLFAAADCRFDFGVATVKPLIEAVQSELAQLKASA